MLKGILTGIVVLVSLSVAHAQGEYSVWGRATVGYSFDKFNKLDTEIQYRRQNLRESNVGVQKPLLESFRWWYHRNLGSDFNVSLSPFAYFSHSQNDLSKEDYVQDSREIRFSAAGQWQKSIAKNWQISNRAAVESRHFTSDNRYVLRARNRIGLKAQITDNYSLSLSEELLVNPIGKVGKNPIDHNRVQLMNEIRISPHLKSEIGYIWIERYKAKKNIFNTEHVAFVNLYYQIH
ncbi:DUF2490 domain-containing protein [Sphingobacterium composti Ten et al. 2007 non Yoo et al. 2007]|uniref:DUF2490 domain-containing protein n=1 Tax=Sphingobacterium composti TaxID=363260 RepID=UPI00135C10C2|nr:DUF2490 domain-containing protein [Sphingobacterium composti Ten et al. 2007 non Yoo et al. 2007]